MVYTVITFLTVPHIVRRIKKEELYTTWPPSNAWRRKRVPLTIPLRGRGTFMQASILALHYLWV